jgi:hypothetical protein
VLAEEGGSSAAPFPLDPSPAALNTLMRRNDSKASPGFASGSLRIGIKLPFQAHSPLEPFLTFRLISGLENASNPVGPEAKMARFNDHYLFHSSPVSGRSSMKRLQPR